MRLSSIALCGPAAAGLLAAAALAAAPAAASDFTMKIGLGTLNDPQHHWADSLKEAIEGATNKRITVEVYPRGQLGTIASQIQGVQLGTVESFVAPADFFTGVDPRFGVFSIPMLFNNRVHAEHVLEDSELNREILSLGREQGLQVVSVFTHSTAHYFAKSPIRTLDDFKGKKLRVNATPAERERMRLLGGTAVPMDLAEVVPGLQQGVIDGTMSGIAIYVGFNFHEIGKTLTQTDDTMIISVGTVSRAWLERLPEDLRNAVIEEGRKIQAPTNRFSRQQEEQMRGRWKERGGEFVTLSESDQARLRQTLAGVGEDVTKANPAVNALYRRIVETGKKH